MFILQCIFWNEFKSIISTRSLLKFISKILWLAIVNTTGINGTSFCHYYKYKIIFKVHLVTDVFSVFFWWDVCSV